MNGAAERCCAICPEPRLSSDGWFLLTENQWTDRLKILGWSDALASSPSVYAACGAEHVQQLVIHWMAMGTLDYPFARAHSEAKKQSLASILLALISALGGQKRSVRAEEREEEATLALT